MPPLLPSLTRLTTLKSGLRIATQKLPTQTVTVGVYIDSGSRTEGKNGEAHFLEHMSFKGTAKRTQHQLELEIENLGGHLNAYTSREQTAYYAKVFKKDINQAVDILADILKNSKMTKENVERERDVILREAEEVEKQHDETVFDHLHATAYQGTALGRTILGPTENIKSLTREDLQSYISANYLAPRMVIAAAGDIEHEELVKHCEVAFKDFPAVSPEGVEPTPADIARFTGSEIRIREDNMKEAHIAIAFHGVGWSSPDHIPLLVIQSIVGSWDRSLAGGQNLTSRLARDIQTHELANSFMSFNTSYKDTGLFGIYLTTENYDFQDDLSYLVFKEWIRIAMNVTETDLVRAKAQLKTSLLLSLDGTTPVTEEIGRHILTYGRRIETEEMEKLIDAVDVKTVKAIAQKYLYDRDFAVVAKGRIESLPEYPRLRSFGVAERY